MLFCLYVAALRRADSPSKESYRLCKKDYETEEEVRAQQRAVEPLISEMNEHIHKMVVFIVAAVGTSNPNEQ
jgi:hypothetical protein